MRRLLLLLPALVLAGVGLVAAPPAPAAAAACSGTSGVTVVIGSSVRCAAGDPSSGWAALDAVAVVTPVQRQPGFVCKIDGAPSSDPCVNTPPANAYWSYWHAQPGGSWQYSNLGAMSYDPAPGSVEGWSFGAGSPPSVPPPSAPAPAPPPQPAPEPPPAASAPPAGGGGTGGSTGGTGGSTGTGTGSAGGTAPAPDATSAAPGAAGTPAPGTSPAPGTTTPVDPSASASATTSAAVGATPSDAPSSSRAEETTDAMALTAGSRDAGGPPWTAIGGGLLVAGLAAAAGVVAWRRRAADAGPGAYGG